MILQGARQGTESISIRHLSYSLSEEVKVHLIAADVSNDVDDLIPLVDNIDEKHQ